MFTCANGHVCFGFLNYESEALIKKRREPAGSGGHCGVRSPSEWWCVPLKN